MQAQGRECKTGGRGKKKCVCVCACVCGRGERVVDKGSDYLAEEIADRVTQTTLRDVNNHSVRM